MPTKTETTLTHRSETEGVARAPRSASWHQLAGRMIESCDVTKLSTTASYTSGSVVLTCVSPKAVEVTRQVERLKQAKDFATEIGLDYDPEGLVSSIQLLQNLATGPIPVPVASWDPESGASLFFSEGDFYGDLEINGTTIEYLLKWIDGQETQEIYDTEEIEDGRLPPKLLMHLFSSFAKTNAHMP